MYICNKVWRTYNSQMRRAQGGTKSEYSLTLPDGRSILADERYVQAGRSRVYLEHDPLPGKPKLVSAYLKCHLTDERYVHLEPRSVEYDLAVPDRPPANGSNRRGHTMEQNQTPASIPDGLSGHGSAVKDEATTIRSEVCGLYREEETASGSVALARLMGLKKLFASHAQEAVKKALSLKEAKKTGIMVGSTAYGYLSESAAVYKLYLLGKMDEITGESVVVTKKEQYVTLRSWPARVTKAREILKEVSSAASEKDAVEKLTDAAIKLHVDPATLDMFAIIRKAKETKEAERNTPEETAKRYIASAWADEERGKNWTVAFVQACGKAVLALAEENKKGAANVVKPSAAVVLPIGEERGDVSTITPPPGTDRDANADIDGARLTAAKARKAVAAARHAA